MIWKDKSAWVLGLQPMQGAATNLPVLVDNTMTQL
jgi:hypothetical protein